MKRNDINLWWGMWWVLMVIFLIGWVQSLTTVPAGIKAEPRKTETSVAEAKLTETDARPIDHTEYASAELVATRSSGRVSTEPASEDTSPQLILLGWFRVTAYCACESCCGKTPDDPWYGITATGTRATQGRTIAVDPKVIPYGSVVYFEGIDGFGGYVAEDCGGAIKGNDIDLYFDSHEEANNWGVRELDVFTLGGAL